MHRKAISSKASAALRLKLQSLAPPRKSSFNNLREQTKVLSFIICQNQLYQTFPTPMKLRDSFCLLGRLSIQTNHPFRNSSVYYFGWYLIAKICSPRFNSLRSVPVTYG
jgi:hypothetical protein